jgi:Zn finger protein HypA/HybF involved in hydrogenase expression
MLYVPCSLHDFLLAKEIIDEILKVAKEKNVGKIKNVTIEIGSIALSHDGFDEHVEDISLDNLQFGLENIAKNTILAGAEFKIIKVKGESWKIINLET